ncbi:hypothetical protein MYRA21_0111 [Myroides sp. A21]|uniref:hypothetical protein n=1 Tax=Myroides sp. A21 TaxID=1583100 RepID=UPI000580AA23|nr:hypothetical protein [Myroides sp. A21]AJA67355.1 hypothetical protein MYRA21_0111 [Myroides sp. A21]
MENWEKEFRRIIHNPIYFLDMYYNKVQEETVNLTDEEKQEYFDKYKGAPLFRTLDDFNNYNDRLEKYRAEGYKDWEIL